MKNFNCRWLWLVPVGVAGLTVGVLAALNFGIEAETTLDNPDPKLRSRFYNVGMKTVQKSIREIIPQLRSYGVQWRLVSDNEENKIAAEVPVLMFTDDLTVTLSEEGNGTRVDVHSQTRVQGKSDLGENRRHILQLLAALDKKLTAES